jgi:hypothetical protein
LLLFFYCRFGIFGLMKICLVCSKTCVSNSTKLRLIISGLVIWRANQILSGKIFWNLYWSNIASILRRILFLILDLLDIFLEIITSILKLLRLVFKPRFCLPKLIVFLVVIVKYFVRFLNLLYKVVFMSLALTIRFFLGNIIWLFYRLRLSSVVFDFGWLLPFLFFFWVF